MQTVDVRLAQQEDFKAVQDLNHDLFISDSQYVDDLNNDWPYAEKGAQYFKDMISGKIGVCFVAEMDGEIVGYLVGRVRRPNGAIAGKRAELENMLVKDSFRNQGVGDQLGQAFLKWCKNNKVDYVIVGAFAKNTDAISFYQGLGFEPYEAVLRNKL
jgi:GNAT superfamily N-acetyltransferase